MNELRLSWIERWALRVLHRSHRISLVIVKPADSCLFSWSLNPTDPIASALADMLMDCHEPPDMMLERLYHSPAYGELE